MNSYILSTKTADDCICFLQPTNHFSEFIKIYCLLTLKLLLFCCVYSSLSPVAALSPPPLFSSSFFFPKISFHRLSYFFEPPHPLAFGLNAISVLWIRSLWSPPPSLKNRHCWDGDACRHCGGDRIIRLVALSSLNELLILSGCSCLWCSVFQRCLLCCVCGALCSFGARSVECGVEMCTFTSLETDRKYGFYFYYTKVVTFFMHVIARGCPAGPAAPPAVPHATKRTTTSLIFISMTLTI